MKQRGISAIFIIIFLAVFAILSVYFFKSNYFKNFISDFLLSKPLNNSSEIKPSPTTAPGNLPTKTPPTKTVPLVASPNPTSRPAEVTNPATAPSAYPTSSASFDEGLPKKNEKPFVGG